jgi:hypothetical protein
MSDSKNEMLSKSLLNREGERGLEATKHMRRALSELPSCDIAGVTASRHLRAADHTAQASQVIARGEMAIKPPDLAVTVRILQRSVKFNDDMTFMLHLFKFSKLSELLRLVKGECTVRTARTFLLLKKVNGLFRSKIICM